MLPVFLQSQNRICIHYGRKNYNDDLVQDAIAVLMFPCSMQTLRKGSRVDQVCAHLNKWGKKAWPDPNKLEAYDVRIIFQLSRLCRWLWRYIKDYLGKATGDFLLWAYSWLPEWSVSTLANPTRIRPRHEPDSSPYFNKDPLTGDIIHLEVQPRTEQPEHDPMKPPQKMRSSFDRDSLTVDQTFSCSLAFASTSLLSTKFR